jgi:ribosome maturation factor RimP
VTSARDAALDDLRAVVARVAAGYGLELFDLQFRREASGWVLRVMLDRLEGEVGIEDCSRVSRDVSALLDVEEERFAEVLGSKYTLEVSSPGLDRPLRGEADYLRFVGRLAKVVTREPVNGQSAFAGRLAGVEDGVVLMTEGKRTHRVPLSLVSRARLDVEF